MPGAWRYMVGSVAWRFGIEFEDSRGWKQLVHQTSWGMTTRCMGIMIMASGPYLGLN